MNCTVPHRRFPLLVLSLLLLTAASVKAEHPQSQVAAEAQGVAVAISNWTPHSIFATGEDFIGEPEIGPGFPFTLLPYQNTGTGVYLRGGPASDQSVAVTYEIQNGAETPLQFTLYFQADTVWDVKAAASMILHAIKKEITGKVKKSLKKEAQEEGDEALEAAGAEDGMTEVAIAMKVIEDIGKLFEALDPTFVILFGFYPTETDVPGQINYYDNGCVTVNSNTPGPANVIIVGPEGTITSSNADEYFVVAAGSTNQYNPGFVDVSVSSLCDYVCSAWDATLDYLGEYSSSDCENAPSGSTELTNYQSFSSQNSCLAQAIDGSEGVAWISPPAGSFSWFVPTDSCTVPATITYPQVSTSVCGSCPEPEGTPAGSWSSSCTETSFEGSTLCANCATDTDPSQLYASCSTCETEVWTNQNGQLACDTSLPGGSWQESCDLETATYNGTAQSLCAYCTAIDGSEVNSCSTCSNLTWENENGQLACSPLSQTARLKETAPPPDRSSLSRSYAVNSLFGALDAMEVTQR